MNTGRWRACSPVAVADSEVLGTRAGGSAHARLSADANGARAKQRSGRKNLGFRGTGIGADQGRARGSGSGDRPFVESRDYP